MICDIVSDEGVPEEMQNDPELWSGCISGALTEGSFLQAFEHAGFYGVQILKRDAQPWRTVLRGGAGAVELSVEQGAVGGVDARAVEEDAISGVGREGAVEREGALAGGGGFVSFNPPRSTP